MGWIGDFLRRRRAYTITKGINLASPVSDNIEEDNIPHQSNADSTLSERGIGKEFTSIEILDGGKFIIKKAFLEYLFIKNSNLGDQIMALPEMSPYVNAEVTSYESEVVLEGKNHDFTYFLKNYYLNALKASELGWPVSGLATSFIALRIQIIFTGTKENLSLIIYIDPKIKLFPPNTDFKKIEDLVRDRINILAEDPQIKKLCGNRIDVVTMGVTV